MLIKVVGLDPSLRNWGIAVGTYDTATKQLHIDDLQVTCPVISTGKQVRQNSRDLEAAYQLYIGALNACRDAHAIFVEVPVGSQSARAMASYGVCVGVLGAIRAGGMPFYEVTPTEVKLAATGKKLATKAEMIAWASGKHKEAPWPVYRQKGVDLMSEAKAEHMADAIGAIYAGLAGQAFQQSLAMLAPLNRNHLFLPKEPIPC